MGFRRLLLAALLLLGAGTAGAQDFIFKDLDGRPLRLSDYRGKWVLVNFWATWCPPCLREIPDLVSLHKAHRNTDLVVIGVALDSTEKSVREFVAKQHISYPVAVGDYDLAEQVGQVEALPTSYLFDPNGTLVSYQEGVVTRESVEAYVRNKSSKK